MGTQAFLASQPLLSQALSLGSGELSGGATWNSARALRNGLASQSPSIKALPESIFTLSRAFLHRKLGERYPDTKVVIVVNLYGTPAKLDEIRAICDRYHAVLIEDAAESLGATYKGQQTGTFGTYNAISFKLEI